MRRRSAAIGLRTAAVAVSMAGCGLLGKSSGPTPQEAARIEQEDQRIRAEVEARLAAEPSVQAGRIRVAAAGGEVQLFGAVRGFGALHCAVANAELVSGVVLVIDHLVLEPGPREVRCNAPRHFPGAATAARDTVRG